MLVHMMQLWCNMFVSHDAATVFDYESIEDAEAFTQLLILLLRYARLHMTIKQRCIERLVGWHISLCDLIT